MRKHGLFLAILVVLPAVAAFSTATTVPMIGHKVLAALNGSQEAAPSLDGGPVASPDGLLNAGNLTVAVVITETIGGARNFRAHLSGEEEVPPVDSKSRGVAIFKGVDSQELEFQLVVANISNVTQAHIHCGSAGVNGPVVVFLYDDQAAFRNHLLIREVLTELDVIPTPPSTECPNGVADFADLIAKMRSGETYVNVHTEANPGGEIRGQIVPMGPPSP
jgi:hypothetical protein